MRRWRRLRGRLTLPRRLILGHSHRLGVVKDRSLLALLWPLQGARVWCRRPRWLGRRWCGVELPLQEALVAKVSLLGLLHDSIAIIRRGRIAANTILVLRHHVAVTIHTRSDPIRGLLPRRLPIGSIA